MLKVTQCANEQPSTDEKHHAQRHLQRDNKFARARLTWGSMRSCLRCLQHQCGPDGECNPQWRPSKQQRSQHQDAQREEENSVVRREAGLDLRPRSQSLVAEVANSHASPPPSATSRRLSVSSWRNNSRRPAPSARRNENSRCRVVLRAISSIATLLSAISRTRPTIAISILSGLPYCSS